jgi:hypothetical protein
LGLPFFSFLSLQSVPTFIEDQIHIYRWNRKQHLGVRNVIFDSVPKYLLFSILLLCSGYFLLPKLILSQLSEPIEKLYLVGSMIIFIDIYADGETAANTRLENSIFISCFRNLTIETRVSFVPKLAYLI